MLNDMKLYLFPDKYYIYGAILFLFLLGSEQLITRWLIFIFFALFLIDWKKLFSIEVISLIFFIFSLYGVYACNHMEIFDNYSQTIDIVKKGAMILIVYMLGVSLRGVSAGKLSDERRIFYLLYAFFIAYAIMITYSYFMLQQESPLTGHGMKVAYKALYVFYGMVNSTHIAYFLSMVSALLPFLLIYTRAFRERKFTFTELLILYFLSLFTLYLAMQMGRRLTIYIVILIFVFMGAKAVWLTLKKHNIYWTLSLLIGLCLVFAVGYYFMSDSLMAKRILEGGLADKRYEWWLQGLRYMVEYPWGGAAAIPSHGDNPYVHNTWIDIGKAYGIFAFLGLIIFYILHFKYYYRILADKKISGFMKSLILIISLVLFLNMLIEPIFHTEQSYFFYSIFFLGFVKAYSDLSCGSTKSASWIVH
jgi:hypothetical protein